MNCIFIGDRFYRESGTIMSSVYEINPNGTHSRTDWGFIGIALKNGKTVNIRPATSDEIKLFEDHMAMYKETDE